MPEPHPNATARTVINTMPDSAKTNGVDAGISTIISKASAMTTARGSSSTSSSAQTSSVIPPSLSSNAPLTTPLAKAPESTTEYIFKLFAAGRITPQEYKTILLGGAFEYSKPCVKVSVSKESNPVRDFITDLRSTSRITQQEYELFSEIYNAEHFDPRVKLVNAPIQLRFPAKNVKKAVEVFNIPELLHCILEHTDYGQGLSHVKLTCRRFNFTVEDSPTLRDRAAFVIYVSSRTSRPGLFECYVHNKMRERVLVISQTPEDPDLDLLMEVHSFLGCKFNIMIEGLHWGWQDSDAPPAGNIFYFDFENCKQTFADYSAHPALRNFRVWDRSVQTAKIIYRNGFSKTGKLVEISAVAPEGQDLTFGHMFDAVAQRVRKGGLVDKFSFKL